MQNINLLLKKILSSFTIYIKKIKKKTNIYNIQVMLKEYLLYILYDMINLLYYYYNASVTLF